MLLCLAISKNQKHTRKYARSFIKKTCVKNVCVFLFFNLSSRKSVVVNNLNMDNHCMFSEMKKKAKNGQISNLKCHSAKIKPLRVHLGGCKTESKC